MSETPRVQYGLLDSSAPFPLRGELTEEDLRGQHVDDARTRFFDAWWMHMGADPMHKFTDAPTYQVHCVDETELRVAQAVQPPFVDATFYLGDERVEPPEPIAA